MLTRLVRSLLACCVAAAVMLIGPMANAQAGHPSIPPNEKELVFGGFGGSFQKSMQSAVIPLFEHEYGVKVTYVPGTADTLMAKAKAQGAHPEVDVIWTNDTTHAIGKREHLFEKLDTRWFTNRSQLYSFALDPDGIGVVHDIQAEEIEYNVQVFAAHKWSPPTSWYDLWNRKYDGHQVIYNMPSIYAILFFAEMAKLEGGSTAHPNAAFTKISQLVPRALAFVNPPAQVDALFSQGGAWITFNGSSRIWELRHSGAPVLPAQPKEGGILLRNLFDIVAGGPHPQLAQAFVNFAVGVEAQTAMSEAMHFGPVNTQVKLSSDLAKQVPYGDDLKRLVSPDLAPISANLSVLTDQWNTMIAGK